MCDESNYIYNFCAKIQIWAENTNLRENSNLGCAQGVGKIGVEVTGKDNELEGASLNKIPRTLEGRLNLSRILAYFSF